jgi:hypothetical protein
MYIDRVQDVNVSPSFLLMPADIHARICLLSSDHFTTYVAGACLQSWLRRMVTRGWRGEVVAYGVG